MSHSINPPTQNAILNTCSHTDCLYSTYSIGKSHARNAANNTPPTATD